jgi:hypothetical protein
MVYIFYAAMLKRKINTNFLLASMKTKKHLLNLKIVPKDTSKFLNQAFLLSHWSIFSNVRMSSGCFQNNFSNSYRLLSEQFLESWAVFCIPQQALRRRHLGGFFKLASEFKESSRNLVFTFLPKIAAKPIIQEELFRFLRPSKKYS